MHRRDATAVRSTPDGFLPGQTVTRDNVAEIALRFAASSYNAEARTIEAVFSTGARVRRYGIIEELAISADAIDLTRVTLGQVRLLDSHNQFEVDAILGNVESARIEGGKLVGRIRFADTERGRAAEALVAGGTPPGISVGYRVTQWTRTEIVDDVDVWRADKWELFEVSLVSVPADPQAGIRSAAASSGAPALSADQLENDDMRRDASTAGVAPAAPALAATPAAAPVTRAAEAPAGVTADQVLRAERTRIAEITTIGARAHMPAEVLARAIGDGTTVDAFRAEAFEQLAQRSQASPTNATRVEIGRDETETRRAGMTDALTARLARAAGDRNVQLPEHARAYGEMGVVEMAAESIGHRGMVRNARQVDDVMRRAFHSTSDFPAIFGGALNARLASRYEAAVPTYRRFAAPYTAVDFRSFNVVRAGDFPSLQPISENGEIKQGSFSESKEILQVKPYGVGLTISRQMIVNDNLGAIEQVLGSAGVRVSDWENGIVFAVLNANPALVSDSVAVFHATHGNLGSAAAISIASVGLGRAAMAKQVSLDKIKLNLQPRVLLVGPDKQTEAEQLITSITPAQPSNAVPEAMRNLQVVSDANIAGNIWHLFADPAIAPCFVYGLLEGYSAPRLSTGDEWTMQGVGVKLEHDFGAAASDFRGGFKNPGA